MKRLSAALIFGLFFSVLCFSQTQTGNASYNGSKSGITISHPSLSFNTRVRVTNLGNNLSVEATVNGRIPISSDRIADISREAGDALEMAKTGMTQVQIDVLPFAHASSGSVPVEEDPIPAATEPRQQPLPAAAPAQPQAVAPVQEPVSPAAAVTEIQYIEVPVAYPQSCCNKYLMLALLFLLLVIIVLLVVIVVRRPRSILFPVGPWRFPPWYRRYLQYVKKRRHALRKRGK
jgi:hypothetical protein